MIDRRKFLKWSGLGALAGLVGKAAAQSSPTEIDFKPGAWVHVPRPALPWVAIDANNPATWPRERFGSTL